MEEMLNLKFIEIEYAHKSWEPFFNKHSNLLKKIDDFLEGKDFNPLPENIMRFCKYDLNNVKVVIIGQDTYPARGVATGRAFEVGGLYSWNQTFRQVSLKNIIRNIYGTYENKSTYTTFSEIISDINEGNFYILPPDELFESWSKQGVLLINGALTCEVGQPGSHSEIWKEFMDLLVEYIANYSKNIKFFLWGSYAKDFSRLIKGNKIYSSRHPMMCSETYYDDFLKNPCFKETMNEIKWI